ncbi:MAG TPA: hypothetical protein VHE30_08480 [Polyangiaceae bacterium]|nr:hypothetical protein [Polyangiaceae bacterium]
MRKVEGAGSPRPDETPLPRAAGAGADPRSVAVWCAFLNRLATDAEAALAAAMAYRELDGPGRDVWMASLEQDVASITVPRIALYAPLLAAETDSKRRAKILAAIGTVQADATPRGPAYALASRPGRDARVVAIVAPLYLDFVQVLACSHRPGDTFEWVKHDPIVERSRAPRAGDSLAGAVLEAGELRAAVDDLAITVVAHARKGLPLPEALGLFADLFGPGGGAAPSRFAIPG